MSHHQRRTASVLFTPALAIVIAACSAAGGASSPPTSGPSGAPSTAPTASPAADAIEHKTGATDLLLRYEEGGGFIMPAFTAAAVPHFTLYGDGTVIFRNPMLEAPAAEGSVFKMNPLRTAKLSEEQIQDLLKLALTEGGLAVARPEYRNDMVADAGTAIFTIEAGGLKKTVSVYALGLERLAGRGDLDAVRELADLISLAAQVHAENGDGFGAERVAALWLAASVAVGAGTNPKHKRAKEALRHDQPDATDLLLRSAAETAARAGMSDALALAANSIGFAAEDVPNIG